MSLSYTAEDPPIRVVDGDSPLGLALTHSWQFWKREAMSYQCRLWSHADDELKATCERLRAEAQADLDAFIAEWETANP